MNPLLAPAIGGIVQTIGSVIGDLVTTDKERLDAEIELRKLGLEELKVDAGLQQGQIDVNKAEAAHPHLFVSGWRPAIGWIGAAAMGYQFLAYPFLVWAWSVLQAMAIVPADMTPPPMLDTDALWVILTGMLGLGAARTVEKVRGVAR